MNSQSILYSKRSEGKSETPAYAVWPIIKYLDKLDKIWCPFDKEDSCFVTMLDDEGFSVYNSHIDYGQDYFEYEPDDWDVMVSNPPFCGKRQIFERALSFNKPFALLMSNTWLNDSAPVKLFKEKELQLLMFDRRIQFNDKINKITFASSYFCWNFLPKQIIMEHLEIKFGGLFK